MTPPLRRALVTGGGTGIGRAIARRLRERGLEVVIVGRRSEVLDDTADALGAIALPADIVAEPERVIAEAGPIQVLVSNAGHQAAAPIGGWTATDFAELYHAGEWTGEVSATVSEAMERLYDAEVRFTDAQVGAFLDELRADGVLDDTLVVLTADHGEEFGEHGMIGHGDTLYPELLHVPLMLRFPDGWRAGERETAPTSHLHLPPTILDAVGLGETLADTTFAGESLLRGTSEMPIYAWRYREGDRDLYALRVGDELVIEGEYDLARAEGGAPEVYDLGGDPGALDNLAGSDPTRLERLRALLGTVRSAYSENAFEGGSVHLDDATRAELEALGYL